jgi:hypothetical protein
MPRDSFNRERIQECENEAALQNLFFSRSMRLKPWPKHIWNLSQQPQDARALGQEIRLYAERW